MACLALPYDSTLCHKRHDFRGGGGGLLNTNCVFWFSLQLLSVTFLILRRTERDVIINVYWSSCKVHYSSQISIKLEFSWKIFDKYSTIRGTRWRSWLRHCATSQKVAGSIPNGVTGFFHWHNPSGRTMALGSTQPLTEMSTRNISWGGKDGRCVWLTTLPPSCADYLEI